MNARPQIKTILLERKLLRWCRIARCPLIDPKVPPARARKNFWRLARAHPELLRKLALTETSVYDPL